ARGMLWYASSCDLQSTGHRRDTCWPTDSANRTGAWSGHHDLVNPTFYVRATRQTIPAQGLIFETEQFLGDGVETLYEAFKRVHGPDVLTASIHEPQSRGADHSAWERRIVGDKQ